ncbi:MAG: EAL domain-containing protein [Alcanivoracaceae bacterium]|nr:EAL domain-containing protein [Alcanivoracaceae bacterium]
MHPDNLVFDVIRFGLVVSSSLFALVLWGYGRGGVGRGYLFLAAAAVLAALRHLGLLVLPASAALHLAVDLELVLRGVVLLFGVQLLTRDRARWPLVLAGLVSAVLVVFGWWRDVDLWMHLPGSVMAGAGFLAAAWHFWQSRDRKRPLGFLGASACLLLTGLFWLSDPVLALSRGGPWGLAMLQGLYAVASMFLILALYQSEKLRADFASEIQERALLRVLRSRRRVVQLREWTDVLLRQITDGVVVCDLQGVITGFNRSAEIIYGYRASEVLGQSVMILIPEDERPPDLEAFLESLNGGEDEFSSPREVRARHKDGSELELEMVVSPMSLSDARQLVAIVRDISERKQQQEQLNYMARHDALTGLPNRKSFEAQVSERLAAGEQGACVFVDLDDFKLLNDTLGHKAGDLALVAMSRRLRNVAGEQASVARQSGDEFVIFLPGMRDRETTEAWLEQLVTRVRQPVTFGDVEFGLSCSVGIADTSSGSEDVEGLIRRADLAMYHAKRSGKNRHSYFTEEMLEESSYTAELASQLKRLDLEKELSLVFQPRMHLDGRQLAGAEVLLRWRNLKGENIPPDRFIPVAEETGQILRIGYWVLEESCRYLSRWGHYLDLMVLSINLSPRQLFDEKLVERIEDVRNRYGLAPAQLEFEITESSAMQDIGYAIRVLSRLRALGYGLSLDDFGTGFSSLSHMRSLPVDTIKIDRSFVSGIDVNRGERVMVAGIIELASHLGMRVLAEGVETREQLDILDSLGCDEAQGYLIGKPMPAEAFRQLVLEDWDTVAAPL